MDSTPRRIAGNCKADELSRNGPPLPPPSVEFERVGAHFSSCVLLLESGHRGNLASAGLPSVHALFQNPLGPRLIVRDPMTSVPSVLLPSP